MAEEILKNDVEIMEVDTKPQTTNNNVDETKEVPLSIEEQLAQIRVENARLKRGLDKATSEASNYKKQLRAKQSEDEIALQEKAERELEREEKFKSMERELNINRLEKNFVMLGYSEQQAHDASIAQIDGDTESLFKIQSEVQQAIVKSKEQEWLASRPPVNSGYVEGNDIDPFLQGFGL